MLIQSTGRSRGAQALDLATQDVAAACRYRRSGGQPCRRGCRAALEPGMPVRLCADRRHGPWNKPWGHPVLDGSGSPTMRPGM